jgi:hypothetical protein
MIKVMYPCVCAHVRVCVYACACVCMCVAFLQLSNKKGIINILKLAKVLIRHSTEKDIWMANEDMGRFSTPLVMEENKAKS